MQKKTNFSSQKLKNSKLDTPSTIQPPNNSTTQLLNPSTSDSFAVRVEGVSKKYCKSLKRSMLYGVKDIARNTFGLCSHSDKLRKNEFWALDDISFEVKKGETLGIIGPNGSGKTTLLKLLNGIFWPDKGKITVKGRVGALIQVGAGFHPLLSGRENVYINAAILGLTKKEIDAKFDEIVEFADIGDFLDVPVKHYSSGMFVRLGFAIAINIEPEILLIDEILSVGDLSFQNKSLRRLAELREKAHAVVFVSHNLEHVRTLCDKIIVLEHGKILFLGDTYKGVQKYEELTRDTRLKNVKMTHGLGKYKYYSSGDIEFLEGGIMDEKGKIIDEISIENDVIAFLRFRAKESIESAKISIAITDKTPVNCIWQYSNDKNREELYKFEKGEHFIKVKFKNPKLAPGVYSVSFSIRNQKTGEIYEKNLGYMPAFKVTGKAFERGIIYTESEWDLKKIGED